MGFSFEGQYRKATLEGTGKMGEALSLRDANVRFPVLLDARAGKVEARAEGLVGDLYAHPTLDLNVRIAAPSMAMLFPLTGIVLPNTPAFETQGHLNGAIDPENVRWRYADFTGSVGKSDLNGDLTYDATGERPKLSGEMRSKLLRFEDLGPIVGVGGAEADPAAPEAKAQRGQKESNTRPGKVLPNDEFLTDRWRAMDLDLRFTGERIVRDAALPFQRLRTHAIMDDGVLKLQPLAFGVADGEVEADITLDGRQDPMRARVIANVNAVQLPRLFPTVELMQKSAGRIDGAVALSARGNSIAELLGEAGGEVKVYLQSGRVSKFLLEAASLNIASAVVAKLFGDSEVRIRCAGISMALKDGLGTMRDFQISTEDALIDVTGAVDFKDERLALDIKPESTGLRIVSLRTPLYVNGTFAKPDIGLEKGPLLLRAGAAAALIAIAPAAAALLPVTVPGDDEQPDCGQLLAHARSKPSLNPDTSAPIESPTVRTGGNAASGGQAAAPREDVPQAQPANGGAPTSTLRPR
ncbi:AsmA family protein [Achromobacter sp. GG226]|nr:AsmA family protein [Verticiella sp. GG226]